ncbi:MAG: galactose mutarotase [Muribaculaceae bacterium]|nr:galactose mutarotase [Muribaculaceae bacterium]
MLNQTLQGDITLVCITNSIGAKVVLSSLGAGINSIIVPDSNGSMADVVIGYANPADYLADGPCAGKIPGRYANRIARGHFSIDGHEYSLAINNGPNALHGGPTGFQNRIWQVKDVFDNSVTFHYRSADGEEGYPGTLDVFARYIWSDDCRLTLEMWASVEGRPTVINLTNHAYFNLGGHQKPSVLDHTLMLNASQWLPTDDTLIPLPSAPADVAGTPMDFTEAKSLGRDIKADFPALKYGKGYDNCWLIDRNDNNADKHTVAAVLSDPDSGRTLTVSTDQPAVQIYTGNWLEGCPTGKDGVTYHDYCAVAIECQNCPDAPNRPDFPSPLLKPGDTYRRTIEFHFGNK